MKKVNVRKIILMVVVIVALCVISSVNYATGNVNDLIENITTLPSNGNNVVNNNVNTNNNVQNITPIGGTNTNTNRNTTTNSVLPQTGVNDTMLWVFIGISVVAAIYTYKNKTKHSEPDSKQE